MHKKVNCGDLHLLLLHNLVKMYAVKFFGVEYYIKLHILKCLS
jgi:hypothetical protein